jgi:hypothetical protein
VSWSLSRLGVIAFLIDLVDCEPVATHHAATRGEGMTDSPHIRGLSCRRKPRLWSEHPPNNRDHPAGAATAPCLRHLQHAPTDDGVKDRGRFAGALRALLDSVAYLVATKHERRNPKERLTTQPQG